MYPFIFQIPPREGRSATNIQLCLRFSPNSLGTGQICERTEVFKDINEAIIFNISGDDSTGNPQVFVFNLSHMSSNFKEWEDGFIIIDLFSVSKISPRQCLGEVVIQVIIAAKREERYFHSQFLGDEEWHSVH